MTLALGLAKASPTAAARARGEVHPEVPVGGGPWTATGQPGMRPGRGLRRHGGGLPTVRRQAPRLGPQRRPGRGAAATHPLR